MVRFTLGFPVFGNNTNNNEHNNNNSTALKQLYDAAC